MKIHIENFQIIKSLDIDLKGIVVISGKSNNGKSAIFRAIRALCLGRSGDAFIRHGAKSCTVALMDEVRGDPTTWAWSRAGSEISYYLNEKQFVKTGGLPPPDYVSALGIKMIELAKLSVLPNFEGQFDDLFIVDMSPTEAASAMAYLFSGEKFPQLLKDIARAVKEDKKSATFLEGEINALVTNKSTLDSDLRSLSKYEPLFPLIDYITTTESFIQDINKDLSLIEEKFQRVSELDTQLSFTQSKLQPLLSLDPNASQFITDLSYDIGLYTGTRDRLLSLRDKLSLDILKYSVVLNAFNRFASALEIERDFVDYTVTTDAIRSTSAMVSVHTSALRNNSERISLLEASITHCPHCSSSLDEEHKRILLTKG